MNMMLASILYHRAKIFRSNLSHKYLKYLSTVTQKVFDVNASEFVVHYRNPINRLFIDVSTNEKFTEKAASLGINSSNWSSFLLSTRRNLLKNPENVFSPDKLNNLRISLDEVNSIEFPNNKLQIADSKIVLNRASEFLFNLLLESAEVVFRDTLASYRSMCLISDLRMPHEWYPMSRLSKRKIIFHGGPTNSGKTYQALQRLKQANPDKGGGMYCGPLRLLALEVYEALNRGGVVCNLRTGQVSR